MLPPERDLSLIWDMLEADTCVQQFVQAKEYAEYEREVLLRRAVERSIEIIGEAARGVSQQVRERNPQVPWKQIIALRHVIAHEYGKLISERMWVVATERIPLRIEELRVILRDLQQPE